MTVSLVGAVYGTSFAVALSRRASLRESSADRWLAGLIICAVTAIMTIVLQHRVGGAFAIQSLERLEFVATLSSGPFLLLYVRSLAASRSDWRQILHFVPACAIAAVPASLAPPVEVLVVHQVLYTSLSVYQRMREEGLCIRDARISLSVLVVMGVVHAAQVARIVASSSESLVDVVPVTMSLAALVFGGMLSVISIGGGGRAARSPASAVRPDTTDASRVRSEVERVLAEEHLYRRTDLGLRDLAGRLGITPHELSGVLNAPGGTGFVDLVARHRLEDAKRRLLDPAHDTYTIEAIGEMSGFGSRSSFHAVFRRELGTTPLRFRASKRAEGSPDSDRFGDE